MSLTSCAEPVSDAPIVAVIAGIARAAVADPDERLRAGQASGPPAIV